MRRFGLVACFCLPNRQIASRITVRLASGISRRLGRWIHPAPVFAVTR
ncbi:hypothetical protein ABLO16_13785 [Mycobacterium tuberculosis]